jgi:hypothetical protein
MDGFARHKVNKPSHKTGSKPAVFMAVEADFDERA